LTKDKGDAIMKITNLIVLNGGRGNDYEFTVGCVSHLGMVEKIKKDKEKEGTYIIFLEGYRELDIITDRVLVVTQY
jgi:hypothetical protein